MNDLAKTLEALLFVSGEPVSIKKLAGITGKTEQEVRVAADMLGSLLQQQGIRLLAKDTMLSLVTAPEAASAVEELIKSELLGDLSKAALETLTIIAYKHPISRAEIDYIRGVNSSFTLRNLIMRGLVERIQRQEDARTYMYRPTIEFMKFLGIQSFNELPEHAAFQQELQKGLEHRDHEDN